jgi:hypothetical protein
MSASSGAIQPGVALFTVVQWPCKENQIEDVIDINRIWLIPKDAKKPVDARRK